jgi:hypothetical protein
MESCAAELERKVWSVRAEFGEGCTVLSTGLTLVIRPISDQTQAIFPSQTHELTKRK